MPSIISKVTELDKEMRLKVKKLKEERAKLPIFLREKRDILTKKYNEEAKEKLKLRKEEIEASLDTIKSDSEKRLKEILTKMEEFYENNRKVWVEKIYSECIYE